MTEDTAEKATVSFKPLELPKGEAIETPRGRKLELLFQETPISRDAPDIVQLKSQAQELLGEGYDYFRSLVGEDFKDLSDRYVIEFAQGRFRHGGILMHLDVDLLRELAKNPGHSYTKDLVQSLVVHEIGHNLTSQEDIPMLAEMIYMIEKGHTRRIEEIKGLLAEGQLPPPHARGLAAIGQWLGYDSPLEMLDSLPGRDLDELKNIFKQKAVNHPD